MSQALMNTTNDKMLTKECKSLAYAPVKLFCPHPPGLDCEETTHHCVNCKGDHPAYDSHCPSFITRQKKGAKRRKKTQIAQQIDDQ